MNCPELCKSSWPLISMPISVPLSSQCYFEEFDGEALKQIRAGLPVSDDQS